MSQHVRSIDRAITLLNCLGEYGVPVTLQKLSELSGLPASTVYRLLTTLEDNDFVERDPVDGTYLLGLRLLELGSLASSSRYVIRIARPYMQRVTYELNESVSLAQIMHGEVLILDYCESKKSFHFVSKVGANIPIHCTVQGKIMLAHMQESKVKEILKEQGMRAYTPNTKRTYDELKTELAEIKKCGYAIDNSEFHIGMFSVAAPIHNADGKTNYSFAIVGMFHKIGSPAFEKAKQMALDAAEDISRALGYRPA